MRSCIKARSIKKGEELCHSAKPGQLPERDPDCKCSPIYPCRGSVQKYEGHL